jgi:hypothetical protein
VLSSFSMVLLQQRRWRQQVLESIVHTMLKPIYLDDMKHSWAGHKTSPTMWSLCSAPIQHEILWPSIWEK